MNGKLSQLFKNTKDLEPSIGLEIFILAKIEATGKRSVQKKLVLSYAGLLGSVAAGLYAVLVFGSGIIESEFFNLMSLAFSDLNVVIANWKDFSYSLLETLPIIQSVAILVPVFLVFWLLNFYASAKSAMKNPCEFHGHTHIRVAT